MRKTKVQLGDKVRDPVTGFEGIAIGLTEWLHGCTTVSVRPQTLKKDGDLKDSVSFDEPQLEIVKAKAVISKEDLTPDEVTRTGGPRDEPQRPRR